MYPQEVKTAIEEVENGTAVLLDVRRDDEWDAGHAKPAVHFNSVRLLTNGELPELDKTIKIYTYCQSGGRAGRVKTALINHGFEQVENLGGLNDWYSGGGQ